MTTALLSQRALSCRSPLLENSLRFAQSDAITTLCVIRISSHRRDRILLTASELLKIDTADAPCCCMHRSGLLSILVPTLDGARCSAIKTADYDTHTLVGAYTAARAGASGGRALQIPGNSGGGERDRTDDPLLAKQVLSQLSYTPREKGIAALVGLVGFEPTTPALSRRCSNQLSYRPLPTRSKTATFVRKAMCICARVCLCLV